MVIITRLSYILCAEHTQNIIYAGGQEKSVTGKKYCKAIILRLKKRKKKQKRKKCDCVEKLPPRLLFLSFVSDKISPSQVQGSPDAGIFT